MIQDVDIKEIELYEAYPEAFRILLRDNSRLRRYKEIHRGMCKQSIAKHADDPEHLIIWATDDYASKGEGYTFFDPITIDKVTGENGMLIRPRCKKSIEEQSQRIKDKAEVFTPSWVCNVQNNLVDEAWFGRRDVFNREVTDEDGNHSWQTITEPITDFPEGKIWQDYVRDTRMEITCGEAPYLCSRYDTTTGVFIPTTERIGLLDRKLRIISENCNESAEWLQMARIAYQNIFGYEWQGDNLLLARESLLNTFLEFYYAKFNELPAAEAISEIADIISWNIWQMDGLKMVTPRSCENIKFQEDLFSEEKVMECPGCKKKDVFDHIGIHCYIKNWNNDEGKQIVQFAKLIQRPKH